MSYAEKRRKTRYENYTCVTLFSVIYNFFYNILLIRITPYAEKILGEYECAFRANRSTINQIFNMRQAMEKFYENNRDMHILFIDYKQFIDSIKRAKLVTSLERQEIPHKIINLIKLILDQLKAKVAIGKAASDTFEIKMGVRQCDALLSFLTWRSTKLYRKSKKREIRYSKLCR